jgi:adenylylsulfate kinase-like enzyme
MPHGIGVLLVGMGGVGKSTTSIHLAELLRLRKIRVELVHFDQLRKKLAPSGVDPFSADLDVKRIIYDRAAQEFNRMLAAHDAVIIDSGLSVERIRCQLKKQVPGLFLVHLTCPLWVAVARDTMRSLQGKRHERGEFLHLRAIVDRLNIFKREKFPQPGITYPFEHPACADLTVSTYREGPSQVAQQIVDRLSNHQSTRVPALARE